MPAVRRIGLEVITGDNPVPPYLSAQHFQLPDGAFVLVGAVEVDPVEVVIGESGKDFDAVSNVELAPLVGDLASTLVGFSGTGGGLDD